MKLEVISRRPAPGAGRTHVLFIHGSWHGAWCWDEYFLPYFASRGYTAHALSLRAHGGSECDRPLKAVRIADYLADVERIIDGLPQPLVIVGHSMGGFIIQHYLETHRAAAAVLMAPIPHSGVLSTTLRLMARHPWLFLKVNLKMSLYPMVGSKRLAREAFFRDDLAPDKLERYFSLLGDESYLGFLDMLFLDLPRPGDGRTPVLVLAAGRDRLFFPGLIRRTARRYGTEPVVVREAAHDLMLDESRREAADRIIEWLAGQGV